MNSSGAKGDGLDLLTRLGLPTPQTAVVDLRRPDPDVFTSIASSGSGWILRSSPVVDQSKFPKMSGMFASVYFRDTTGLYEAANQVLASTTRPDVISRLEFLGLDVPSVVGLVQPYLVASVGGIAHVYPGKTIDMAFLAGQPTSLASGERTGSTIYAALPYTGLIQGAADLATDIATHGAQLHKALTAFDVLNEWDVALEVEWLVTTQGQLFALQAQELHDRGYGS